MKTRAFILIELLVVVLIIGILAAIAVPQYQKAVLKADLHKGINLVESLYQAQQAYLLAHDDFAKDIDDLDISIPKDESCTKTQLAKASYYFCSFGRIGFWDDFANVQFQNKKTEADRPQLAYLHFLKKRASYEANKRYCFAKPNNNTANGVCQGMGGILIEENDVWNEYILD